ncbi:pyridoxamine 5'-phosphate oxidase [Bacteriovorax sp. DB6_IX]|uniref:pyridoxamine 5'-phosphate oxidase n=1 Tax=Bacteriovorax sp. DB6_IX TaxID=1353530 RepID=UPI00038A090E|nr:pyridoxamine 5'-phosphate oxidase [Bacteriovorax sp. DB6_IX]EQC50791.1 pyridoxamine 5'-phosphate oxidase [Bacteriovorax sp. DB6_IX]
MTDYKNYLETDNPIHVFEKWFKEALEVEDNGYYFTLSTVAKDGGVNARTLLLKKVHEGKPLFFTNYNSVKAEELEENNHMAMTFYWDKLGKQVRIRGTVTKAPREVSENYFKSRGFESQVASFISNQSSPVKDREQLENEFSKARDLYAESGVPYPENWGGYLVEPYEITFFIYGDHRLNDRFQFQLKDGKWENQRLYP